MSAHAIATKIRDEVREDGIAHTIRFVAEELGWRVSREAFSVKALELATD